MKMKKRRANMSQVRYQDIIQFNKVKKYEENIYKISSSVKSKLKVKKSKT